MAEERLAEFADRVNSTMSEIMKGFAKEQAKGFYDIKVTIPQIAIMGFLYREGECKMTGLANFMNVTTAAVTGVVDRLVREGYVVRSSNPDDRRVVKIRLTAKGRKISDSLNQHRRYMTMKVFSKISQSDRDNYLRILEQIRDKMR